MLRITRLFVSSIEDRSRVGHGGPSPLPGHIQIVVISERCLREPLPGPLQVQLVEDDVPSGGRELCSPLARGQTPMQHTIVQL